MKITSNLPQFSGRPYLIIVAGRQEAKFYLAGNSVIRTLESFRVRTPLYSDREGFFEASGRMGVIRSGSAYEPPKEAVIQEFIRGLKEHLAAIEAAEEIASAAVFAPNYMKGYIRSALSASLEQRLELVVEGNFYRSPPLALWRKIWENREPRAVKPRSGEADNLWHRGAKQPP